MNWWYILCGQKSALEPAWTPQVGVKPDLHRLNINVGTSWLKKVKHSSFVEHYQVSHKLVESMPAWVHAVIRANKKVTDFFKDSAFYANC